MADLSNLFGAPRQPQQRRNPFDVSESAAGFTRKIVMQEAMDQDLAPDDGQPFFEYVGRRLFELGDTQGAFAVGEQFRQLQAAEAQAQQQGFENLIKAEDLNLRQSKERREAGEGKTTSRLTTGAELGLQDPGLQDAAIEVKENNGQIVGFEVLSKGGTSVDVDVDARPPQIGGVELEKKTLNDLHDQVITSNESIGRLSQINTLYDARFLQLGTRMKEFGSRIKDFVGTATPEDQQLISEFQDFKSTALENLNLTLNQLSGAAVSPQEFKRISNAMPNPGTGIFDGDSPTEFMSTLRARVRDLKLARARANWILAGGGKLEDINKGRISLPSMARIMDKKVKEWDAEGRSKSEIAQLLRDTFGEF